MGSYKKLYSSSTRCENHTFSAFLEKIIVKHKLLYTQLYMPIMTTLILTMLPIRKKMEEKKSMGKLELKPKSHCSWAEKGAKRDSSMGNLFPFSHFSHLLYSFSSFSTENGSI